MIHKYFPNGDCDNFNKFSPTRNKKTIAVNLDLQSSSNIYEYFLSLHVFAFFSRVSPLGVLCHLNQKFLVIDMLEFPWFDGVTSQSIVDFSSK